MLLWEDRFGEPGKNEFPGSDAIAASDGVVFVAGSAENDFLVRAYSAVDGKLLWADVFDRAGGIDDAIGITPAGGKVFALGGADLPPTFLGIPLIRAYESKTGRLLWQQELADSQGVFDSAVVHEETVIAVGGNLAWLVQAYDAETGTVQWGDRFGVGTSNRAIGVAEHNGRVFVGGRARPPGAALNWFVRAYDASSGNVLWEDHAPAGIGGQVGSVAVEGNQVIAVGTVVARTTTPPFINTDWRIRAYDVKTGALLWEDVVDKGGFFFPEGALDVAVLGGRAFVAGGGGAGCSVDVTAPNNCDFIVRAYELKSGQLLWEDQLDRAPFDLATSVAAKDGRVFSLGLGGNDCDNSGLTNCDILIRAYKPKSGKVLWEDQVDSMGTDDTGQGIAADGGNVFAAGFVLDTADFLADLLVRAYDASGDDEDDDNDDD
jgi:glucose dehydrogenase